MERSVCVSFPTAGTFFFSFFLFSARFPGRRVPSASARNTHTPLMSCPPTMPSTLFLMHCTASLFHPSKRASIFNLDKNGTRKHNKREAHPSRPCLPHHPSFYTTPAPPETHTTTRGSPLPGCKPLLYPRAHSTTNGTPAPLFPLPCFFFLSSQPVCVCVCARLHRGARLRTHALCKTPLPSQRDTPVLCRAIFFFHHHFLLHSFHTAPVALTCQTTSPSQWPPCRCPSSWPPAQTRRRPVRTRPPGRASRPARPRSWAPPAAHKSSCWLS